MEQNVIDKAKVLVGFYKVGWIEGFDVPFAIGGEPDSMVKVACADTGTNRGEHGVCEYEIDVQETLYGVLDFQFGVVIIAPYESEYHVFVAEYDETIDLNTPLYFLGAFTE